MKSIILCPSRPLKCTPDCAYMHIPRMHGGRRGNPFPAEKGTLVCHSIGSEWYHFQTDTLLRDTCTPYVHEGNEDCMQAHQLSWQCWDERTSSSDSPPAWTCQSPSSSHVRGSWQPLGHFPCSHIHPTHTHICSSHQCVNFITILNEQSLTLGAHAPQGYSSCVCVCLCLVQF